MLYVEQEVPGDDTVPIDYVMQADAERQWLIKEEDTLITLSEYACLIFSHPSLLPLLLSSFFGFPPPLFLLIISLPSFFYVYREYPFWMDNPDEKRTYSLKVFTLSFLVSPLVPLPS